MKADYVIVGAGTAGCVLANRLTESPDVSVCLLEAGGRDTNPLISLPMGETHLIGGKHDWSFDCEPEAQLDGYRFVMPRGKVLGGSSSINGQIYHRGHPRDYDEWAELGCEGWSFAEVLPLFKQTENWEEGANEYRGSAGQLETTRGRFEHPLFDAFMAAGDEQGYAFTDDYNGGEPEGFARVQYTHTHKWLYRCSASRAYLRPVQDRPNLTVITDAQATRVLLDQQRATGVEYVRDGQVSTVSANAEVLLSAGVYQSPQLLLLSGVGDPAELEKVDVRPRHALNGVGYGLQDHFGSFLQYECREPITFYRYRNPLRFAGVLAQYLLKRTGPLTIFPMDAVAHLKSEPNLERPDIQIYLCPMQVKPIREGSLWPSTHEFNLHWNTLRPESRGRVWLQSSDPLARPRIWHNYLATEGDRRLHRVALELCRSIASSSAFDRFRGAETEPGVYPLDDKAFAEFSRHMPNSGYHPVGTCRMGVDDEAVVDAELRVRGLDALRVVDASVMPRLIGGNTNAPTYMIAEKAAQLIQRTHNH